MPVCFQYARPASGSSDGEIFGLDVAVTNLLTAWFAYGKADPFICRPADLPSLEHFKALATAAGATLADLVKTTTFTTDIDEFFRHASVRMRYFGPGLPASTTVEVRRLSHPDFLVEIEAIAHLGRV